MEALIVIALVIYVVDMITLYVVARVIERKK